MLWSLALYTGSRDQSQILHLHAAALLRHRPDLSSSYTFQEVGRSAPALFSDSIPTSLTTITVFTVGVQKRMHGECSAV